MGRTRKHRVLLDFPSRKALAAWVDNARILGLVPRDMTLKDACSSTEQVAEYVLKQRDKTKETDERDQRPRDVA